MRLRRHLPPLTEWRWSWKPSLRLSRPVVTRWTGYLLAALCAGYLTAYLFLFPAPILHAHEAVPRLIGLSMPEASKQLQTAGMHARDGGSEPDATAPQGTVIWQDPPPGVRAPVGVRVTLVSSDGPPKIPVPDLAGIDGVL